MQLMAILKPSPSSPIRFSTGTRTLLKASSPVLPARTPSLPLIVPVVKPSMPRSSTNAVRPWCFLRAVDAGEDEEVIGDIGQRDPHLGAIEDVTIAVPNGGRLDRAGVGPGVWLGQAEGGDLRALRLRHQPALLLLLGRPLQQRQTVQANMDAHDDAQKGVDVLEFFAGEREDDVVETQPP